MSSPASQGGDEEDPFIGLELALEGERAIQIQLADSPPAHPAARPRLAAAEGAAESNGGESDESESEGASSEPDFTWSGQTKQEAAETDGRSEGAPVSPAASHAAFHHAQPASADGVTDEAELPPWMRSANARIIGERTPPISALALDPRLEAAVVRLGVRRCFPVQATVVPMVLAAAAAGIPGDICCCAPTGSGKTLAYSLPILQHLLSASCIRRLRALVLLPTRGLATQVHGVFSSLCEQLPLRVGLAVGMDGASWEEEREMLLGKHCGPTMVYSSCTSKAAYQSRPGGSSAIDVLVATPGRLVEHLRAGGGFTLQHLRWLVIDEADRLLMHGFQSWLPLLLDAAYVGNVAPNAHAVNNGEGEVSREMRTRESTQRPLVGTMHAFARGGPLAFARCFGAAAAGDGSESSLAGSGIATDPLTKLLFSATLTRSAAKLAPLRLERASYFCVSGARYATPATLREWMISCPAQVWVECLSCEAVPSTHDCYACPAPYPPHLILEAQIRNLSACVHPS